MLGLPAGLVITLRILVMLGLLAGLIMLHNCALHVDAGTCADVIVFLTSVCCMLTLALMQMSLVSHL